MLPMLMGGLGVLNAQKDAEQKQKDASYKAVTAAYSPWTGLNANKVSVTEAPGALFGGVKGAVGGAEQEQNMDFRDAEVKAMQSGKFSPWGMGKR